MQTAQRVCPACGREDPVAEDGPIWPSRWACEGCGHVAPLKDGVPLTAPSLADTVDGFDPADFEFLASVEVGHFWFVPRRRLIGTLARKYAPQARCFLEVGCGSGNVLEAIAGSRYWSRIVGLDAHPRGLAFARARVPASVELLQGDARALPLRRAFDLIGAFDVLEHLGEDEAAIASIRSALIDEGILLAAVPQHPSLWSASDDVAHHVRRYQRGELDRKIAAAGFEIVFSTSYSVSLLPLMALRRQLADRLGRETDLRTIARKELEVTPAVNRVLTWALNAETALTGIGVSWPVGGSRIIAARKR